MLKKEELFTKYGKVIYGALLVAIAAVAYFGHSYKGTSFYYVILALIVLIGAVSVAVYYKVKW